MTKKVEIQKTEKQDEILYQGWSFFMFEENKMNSISKLGLLVFGLGIYSAILLPADSLATVLLLIIGGGIFLVGDDLTGENK